jgi:hypothetical protein
MKVLHEWDFGEWSFRLKRAAAKRPRLSGLRSDIGTFVWYKASIWSGGKALILLMLLGLSDNPPLGTIQLLSLCFKSK